jgi:adenylate kinase family enzyme
MNNSSQPQRICVIGTSVAGKTTLARQVSHSLNIPHFELDSLYWEPNWVTVTPDIFRRRAEESLTGNSWIVDGNSKTVRDIV